MKKLALLLIGIVTALSIIFPSLIFNPMQIASKGIESYQWAGVAPASEEIPTTTNLKTAFEAAMADKSYSITISEDTYYELSESITVDDPITFKGTGRVVIYFKDGGMITSTSFPANRAIYVEGVELILVGLYTPALTNARHCIDGLVTVKDGSLVLSNIFLSAKDSYFTIEMRQGDLTIANGSVVSTDAAEERGAAILAGVWNDYATTGDVNINFTVGTELGEDIVPETASAAGGVLATRREGMHLIPGYDLEGNTPYIISVNGQKNSSNGEYSSLITQTSRSSTDCAIRAMAQGDRPSGVVNLSHIRVLSSTDDTGIILNDVETNIDGCTITVNDENTVINPAIKVNGQAEVNLQNTNILSSGNGIVTGDNGESILSVLSNTSIQSQHIGIVMNSGSLMVGDEGSKENIYVYGKDISVFDGNGLEITLNGGIYEASPDAETVDNPIVSNASINTGTVVYSLVENPSAKPIIVNGGTFLNTGVSNRAFSFYLEGEADISEDSYLSITSSDVFVSYPVIPENLINDLKVELQARNLFSTSQEAENLFKDRVTSPNELYCYYPVDTSLQAIVNANPSGLDKENSATVKFSTESTWMEADKPLILNENLPIEADSVVWNIILGSAEDDFISLPELSQTELPENYKPSTDFWASTPNGAGSNEPITLSNDININNPKTEFAIWQEVETEPEPEPEPTPPTPSRPTPNPSPTPMPEPSPGPDSPSDTPSDQPVTDGDSPDFEPDSGINSGVSGTGPGFTESGSTTAINPETNEQITYTQNENGTKAATTRNASGQITKAVITIPASSIEDGVVYPSLGQNEGRELLIPGNSTSESRAPEITLNLPQSVDKAKVVLPIEPGTLDPGTVAMIWNGEEYAPIPATVLDEENGTTSFPLDESARILILNNAITFADETGVPDYARTAAAFTSARGLMTGMGNRLPKPFDFNAYTSRGQFAVILYRLENEPEVFGPYPDGIISGAWNANAARWAKEKGLMGQGNSPFNAQQSISRDQIMTILWRNQGSPQVSLSYLDPYQDADEITLEDYRKAMAWGVKEKLIGQDPQMKLYPADFATRAEIAAIFQRAIEALY